MQAPIPVSTGLTSVAEVSCDIPLRSRQRKLINLDGSRQLRDRVVERHGKKRVADSSCWRQPKTMHTHVDGVLWLTHSYKLWSSSFSTSMAIDIPASPVEAGKAGKLRDQDSSQLPLLILLFDSSFLYNYNHRPPKLPRSVRVSREHCCYPPCNIDEINGYR